MVKVEKKEGLVTISLNRPEMRNAFGPQMIAELTKAFQETSSQSDCRAVILRGEGTSFCAGADLSWMKSMAGYSFDENREDSERLAEMFNSIRNCPHPVIAKVNGHAMGGALGLIAACDIAVAESETLFCFSEVRIGLVPAVISPFVFERMKASHARRWMLTGSVFRANDAVASDLVHFSGDATAVDNFVNSLLKSFYEAGPEAVRETKKLLRSVYSTVDWRRLQDLTTRVIAERRVSNEGQEGLRGFLEKRDPAWKASPPL